MRKTERRLRLAARWIVNGIFILSAAVCVSACVSCKGTAGGEFLRGLEEESLRQAPELAADATEELAGRIEKRVSDKLGQEIGAAVGDAVKSGVQEIVAKIPKPAPPAEPSSSPVAHSIGTLTALLAAFAARGAIRARQERRK